MQQRYLFIILMFILSSANIGFATAKLIHSGSSRTEIRLLVDPPQTKAERKNKKVRKKKGKKRPVKTKDTYVFGAWLSSMIGLLGAGIYFFFKGAPLAPNLWWLLGITYMSISLLTLCAILIREIGGIRYALDSLSIWFFFVLPLSITGLICIIIGMLQLKMGWWLGGIIFLMPLALFLLAYLIDRILKAGRS